MQRTLMYLAASLAFLAPSCGGKAKIYPVSGKVIYQGLPAAGAVVLFLRQHADPLNEPAIMGVVQDDGSFELVCGALGKGAPPGQFDVLIEWKSPGQGRSRRGPDRLLGRFADARRPRFQATVTAKATALEPFVLTAAPGENE